MIAGGRVGEPAGDGTAVDERHARLGQLPVRHARHAERADGEVEARSAGGDDRRRACLRATVPAVAYQPRATLMPV